MSATHWIIFIIVQLVAVYLILKKIQVTKEAAYQERLKDRQVIAKLEQRINGLETAVDVLAAQTTTDETPHNRLGRYNKKPGRN